MGWKVIANATLVVGGMVIGTSSGCTGDGDFAGKRIADTASPATVYTGSGTGMPGTGTGATGSGGGSGTGNAGTGGGTGGGSGSGSGTGGGGSGAGTGGVGTGTGGGSGGGSSSGGTATGGTPTSAPCTAVLPADTVVVTSDGGQSQDNTTYWVCPHVIFSFTGTNALIALENQADVVLNSSGNTVWLPANGNLAAFQPGNLFVHEPGASIDDQASTPNALQQCATITIDSSLVASPGC